MRLKKAVLLFIALLFPACIFVFLKYFGKNEFVVTPLYTNDYPENAAECGISIQLPYRIPDSVQSALLPPIEDRLMLIHFGKSTRDSEKQLNRLKEEHGNEIKLQSLQASDTALQLKKCVFFLQDPYDLVLVDHEGVIRGQYISSDREDVDRLLMEISILFKRY